MFQKTNILFAIAIVISITLVAGFVGVAHPVQSSSTSKAATTMQDKAAPAAAKMTDMQKITDAMSAAPSAISQNASIMDWPEMPNGKPRQLRAGTN